MHSVTQGDSPAPQMHTSDLLYEFGNGGYILRLVLCSGRTLLGLPCQST